MIDAHHHIWMQKDLPWLSGPMQPRIFGDYEAIMRDYLIDEFLSDLSGTGITKSVYVQANWPPDRFEDEVAWVQSVSDGIGWPHAIVGYADFTVDDVRYQLDKLVEYPLMRGIRQQYHWHENPTYRFAAREDICLDTNVQNNIAHLSDYGWTFDLQLFTSQMQDGVQLANACPDVTFILQHAGMLEDTSGEGIQAWNKGMIELAECENVFSKLSAFGTFIHRNDEHFIADMIKRTVDIFDADRCMFGSNFPIEKIWTDYSSLFTAFQNSTRSMSEAVRNAIFNDTAERVYRL